MSNNKLIPSITKVIHNICKASSKSYAYHSIDLVDSQGHKIEGKKYQTNEIARNGIYAATTVYHVALPKVFKIVPVEPKLVFTRTNCNKTKQVTHLKLI